MNERILNVTINADATGSRWSFKELVEKLWSMRDEEITRLWRRDAFLGALLLGEFTAYGMIQGHFFSPLAPGAFLCNALGVAVGLLGVISSLLWVAAAKGACAWYQVYERAIDGLFVQLGPREEEQVLATTCPSIGSCRSLDWSNSYLSGCGGTYSLPRINIAIGHICLVVWAVLIVAHIVLLICGLWGVDFIGHSFILKMIATGLLALMFIAVFTGYCLYSGGFLLSKSLIIYASKERAKSDAVIITGLKILANLRCVRDGRL